MPRTATALSAATHVTPHRWTAVRAAVEEATDRGAEVAFAAAAPSDIEELIALLQPLATAVVSLGVIPYPNPIGVPQPSGGGS